MAKTVVARPDWIKASQVVDVYSVSNCVSSNFADYVTFWKHNGYWLFDSPEVIHDIAHEHNIDLKGTKLFYYEIYELEYHEDSTWRAFRPEATFTTSVKVPNAKQLDGFDIATFSVSTSPECSPLSCNSLAESVNTNEHCLLPTFEAAKMLLEQGKFKDSEPGPYRIFAVYSLEWP